MVAVAPSEGFLVIADITGYTAYLSGSELEHAEDSLRSLLNLLIDHTKPPLSVSRLQGDAVISYAPAGSFLTGQTLVEMIESTYVAFRRARETMVLNTTCDCNACQNIINLDLKFFVHFGRYMQQPLGGYIELVGADVNLIHRLTKNSITDETGVFAYAVYTEPAIEALGLEEFSGFLKPHVEKYDHVGAVSAYVQDLMEVWTREKDRNRRTVDTDNLLLSMDYTFPYPLATVWEYITHPEYRAILTLSDSGEIKGVTGSRVGPGASYMCAHGKNISTHTIVDWQPLEEYTAECGGYFNGVLSLVTTRIEEVPEGTRIETMLGKNSGPVLKRIAEDLGTRLLSKRYMLKGAEKLRAIMDEDAAQGKLTQPMPSEISPTHVDEAVSESLKG